MPHPRSVLTEKQKKCIAGAAFAVFLLFAALVGWFIGRPMIRFVSEPERFRAWVDASGVWGRVLFVGMTALQVVVALIPGEPLEIGAGYAFGMVEGTLLTMLGIALGSAAVFGLVRRFGVALVEVFFSTEKIRSMKWLRDSRRLNLITFAAFFIPGTPKDLLTYFMGLTPIRFADYFWIATLARIPSIVTSTVGGNALNTEDYTGAAIIFAATAVVSIGGILVWRALERRRAVEKAGKCHSGGAPQEDQD